MWLGGGGEGTRGRAIRNEPDRKVSHTGKQITPRPFSDSKCTEDNPNCCVSSGELCCDVESLVWRHVPEVPAPGRWGREG